MGRGPWVAALLAGFLVVLALWVLFATRSATPPEQPGQRVTAAGSDAMAMDVEAREEVAPQRTIAHVQNEQDTAILTFLDGQPVVTACLEIGPTRQPPCSGDWDRASHRHPIAIGQASDSEFALVHRACYVVIVRGKDIARGAQVRVDMQRARRLRVNLLNVPVGLRDKADLGVAVDAVPQSESERLAHMLMRLDSRPVMTDSFDLPLACERDGQVRVWGSTKVSARGFMLRPVPFSASQLWVDIDLSELQRWTSLYALNLVLDFPYAYPTGSMEMSLTLPDGSSMHYGKFERPSEQREVTLVVNDLPPGKVIPTISSRLNGAWIHLESIEIRGDVSSRRSVEAEAVLRVTVQATNAGDLAGCYLLVCKEDGSPIAGGQRKVTHRDSVVFVIEHLPAGAYHVQVQDEVRGYRACSAMTRLQLEPATAQDLSLMLLPSGKVDLDRKGVPETCYLDFRSTTGDSSRYFIRFLGRECVSLPCPVGDYDVVLGGEVRRITVEPGATVPLRFSN